MNFDLCTIDWVAISSLITLIMASFTIIAIYKAHRANRLAETAIKENIRQRQYEYVSTIYGGLLEALARLKFETDYCIQKIPANKNEAPGARGRNIDDWIKRLSDGDAAVRLHRDANDVNYSEEVKSIVEKILELSHNISFTEQSLSGLSGLIQEAKHIIANEINQLVNSTKPEEATHEQ